MPHESFVQQAKRWSSETVTYYLLPGIYRLRAQLISQPALQSRGAYWKDCQVTLPSGQYAQYGSQTGRAILYLHGLPGSRIEAAAFDELAERLGARIIAVDQPCIGWSSPHPERTVLDHTKDIEHLAKHLGLDDYDVFDTSNVSPLHSV